MPVSALYMLAVGEVVAIFWFAFNYGPDVVNFIASHLH